MTTKFYQINGVWNTYQYWHDNYGYTTEPTQSMNFKSSASGTWGTSVNPGYFASPGGDTIDNWSFWSEGIVGWKDIDQLALAGAYPATAIDILLERNGSIANAVYVDDSDELYYLIDGYLSDGWRSWDEVEADGWQVYEGAPPYYMVVNETTGEIVYSISETEENPSMVFSQVGHIEMPDSEMIICIELGVPVEEFWLGANGRSSTDDVTLQANNKQYLRGEDGQLITDAGTIALYDQAPALAYIKADGNTYEAASGDYAFENERYPGSGEDLSLYTVDTGSTRSAWAALFKKKHGFAIFGVMSSTSSDDVEISPDEQFFGVTTLDVPPALEAYFTSQGASATNDTALWGNYYLYDSAGQLIPALRLATYTIVAKYNKAGEQLPAQPGEYLYYSQYGLMYDSMGNAGTAYKLTYTVSDNT